MVYTLPLFLIPAGFFDIHTINMLYLPEFLAERLEGERHQEDADVKEVHYVDVVDGEQVHLDLEEYVLEAAKIRGKTLYINSCLENFQKYLFKTM